MPTHRNVTDAIGPVVTDLIDRDFPELRDAGVTVEILAAHAGRDKEGEPKGPSIKLHGYPCWAVVSIRSQKDRVAGSADARIVIDGDRWDDADERRQTAILAHELTHLDVVKDDDGNIVLDDCHRPKLRMRLHDWHLGGFEAIAEKYGADAVEVEAAEALRDQFGQLLFAFAEAGAA